MSRTDRATMDAFRHLVKLGAIPYGVLFRERRHGLIILIYHRVGGGTDSAIDLPADLFARQMAYLRDHYTMVSMDTVAEGAFDDRSPGSSDVVAVTFDDGCQETYDHAFPVLLRYRIPATIYLTTRYIEMQHPFDFGGYAVHAHPPRPLTWAGVREMVGSGLVSVGAHTHSHTDLTRLSPAAVREEVERSHGLIEDRLGVTPQHFAYPWGVVTPVVKRLVGEYFTTAVRGGSGKNPFGSLDLLALWRRPIQQSDGFWFFRLKLGSYLDGEEYFRRLAAGFAVFGRGGRRPAIG